MANSQDKDLMSIGSHCAVSTCMQLDFLPFSCDCCSKTFCLDHRTYAAHQCPHAKNKETDVIICPICAKGVRLNSQEDPNVVFERHTRTDCDPANYARVHHKPRCGAPGCKEKLTTINTYRCKNCGVKVCLKHRDVDDHKCQARAKQMAAAQQRQQPGSSMLAAVTSWFSQPAAPQARASTARPASGTTAAAAAEARAKAAAAKNTTAAARPAAPKPAPKPTPATSTVLRDPNNSVMGTAAHRRAQWEQDRGAAYVASLPAAERQRYLQQQQQQQQQPAGSLPELCQHCGMRFPDAAQLVSHYEAQHSGQQAPATGAAAAGVAAETFPCPKCGSVFGDAVQLLQHHESCGTGVLRGLLSNLGWK